MIASAAAGLALAFAGTAVPWVTLGLGDFAVKMGLALFMLVPFRMLMSAFRPRAAGGV